MFNFVLGYREFFYILGLSVLFLLYRLSTKNHDYWKKHGVPYIKPLPLVGSLRDLFTKPIQYVEQDRYNKYGPIYGYYEGTKPILVVSDPELIREVLVKDFHIFTSRRVVVSGNEIFDKMVSVMKGDEEWKRIRTIITPTFTTGKIKRMLGIFNDCANTVIKNFKTAALEGKPVDCKKLFGAFTMDTIASSAFSSKLDSHNDPENQFVKYAKRAFSQKLSLRLLVFILFPRLNKLLGFTFFPKDIMEFFKKITYEIIEERQKTGQVRNDFLQLMMDTANETKENVNLDQPEKGDIGSNYSLQEDMNQHILKSVTSKSLSMNELVAQCVGFFIGGYDTTASTLSFATYLLALNPDKQDLARKDVNDAIREANGKMTYEAVQSMKYLDNVISETLRLYPPLIRMERTADADHQLGNTGILLQKGVLVSIPTYAIHRDPNIYPDPDAFEPDRFTPEERAKRDPYLYHPFGGGPRNCVAMRFALMEVKVCLAHVIANFFIKRCPETKVPLEFGNGQALLQPKGVILKMETRKDSPLST